MERERQSLLTNDLVFKKVFTSKENRQLLKGLIETLLKREFVSVEPSVSYHIDTYQRQTQEEDVLQTEVDILATTDNGEKVSIELQLQNHHYFVERTLYYAIEAYRSNYGNQEMARIKVKNNYSSLRHVYGINILDFHLFSEEGEAIRTFELLDRQNYEPLSQLLPVEALSVTYFSLKNQNVVKGSHLYHLQQLIKTGKVAQEAPDFMIEAQAKGDYYNLERGEREMVDQMEKRKAILDAQLSSVRLDSLKEGREEGKSLGRKEGKRLGREEGKNLGREEVAKNLFLKGYEAIEIQSVTGLSSKVLERIQQAIN